MIMFSSWGLYLTDWDSEFRLIRMDVPESRCTLLIVTMWKASTGIRSWGLEFTHSSPIFGISIWEPLTRQASIFNFKIFLAICLYKQSSAVLLNNHLRSVLNFKFSVLTLWIFAQCLMSIEQNCEKRKYFNSTHVQCNNIDWLKVCFDNAFKSDILCLALIFNLSIEQSENDNPAHTNILFSYTNSWLSA